jgi:invasion protein IalB
VRITRFLTVAACVLTLGMPVVAFAQSETEAAPKVDAPAAPEGQAQNFGPRKKVPGQAQQAQAGPKVENVSKHGAWQIQCTEGGEEGGRNCGMVQQTRSEKNEKVGLSVIVNKVKRGDKSAVFMRVMAPIGVYLPTGIPVEIDGAALPARMVFTRCIPPICEAMGEASADSLARFKKGNAATFYLYDRPGNGFPLKISLEGFGAALAALDKL